MKGHLVPALAKAIDLALVPVVWLIFWQPGRKQTPKR